MGYCSKCMNTGVLLNGDLCDCGQSNPDFFDDVVCLQIPEQYRGISFSPTLVKQDLGRAYPDFLEKVYRDITTGNFKFRNLLICSPAGHSKTIMVYSCMQQMFRHGEPITEFKGIDELDLSIIEETNIQFVRIPVLTNADTYKRIATLVDKRVRAGKSTIFIYNGIYRSLVYNDESYALRSLIGDGSFTTIENRSWERVNENNGVC